MTNHGVKNSCTRCGKTRVISKTWTEKLEMAGRMTAITRSESVCPDSECQAVVVKQLTEQRKKKDEMRNREPRS